MHSYLILAQLLLAAHAQDCKPENSKPCAEAEKLASDPAVKAATRNPDLIPCQAAKKALDPSDLTKIKKQLWKPGPFRHGYPGAGMCELRAYLISKNLDELGFQSRITRLNAHLGVAYKHQGKYYITLYPFHTFNTVRVKISEDSQIDYVIDPMFSDAPIPLQSFVKNISDNGEKGLQIGNATSFLNSSDSPCEYSKDKLHTEHAAIINDRDKMIGFEDQGKFDRGEAFDTEAQALEAAKKLRQSSTRDK